MNNFFIGLFLIAITFLGGVETESTNTNTKSIRLKQQKNEFLVKPAQSSRAEQIDQIIQDAAEDISRKFIEIAPTWPPAHYDLGVVLYRQGRYVESEESFRQAIELAPNYAIAHHNLGLSLNAQQRYAEAEASYHRAIELNPSLASP